MVRIESVIQTVTAGWVGHGDAGVVFGPSKRNENALVVAALDRKSLLDLAAFVCFQKNQILRIVACNVSKGYKYVYSITIANEGRRFSGENKRTVQ